MVRLVLRGKRGPDLTALDNKYGKPYWDEGPVVAIDHDI